MAYQNIELVDSANISIGHNVYMHTYADLEFVGRA